MCYNGETIKKVFVTRFGWNQNPVPLKLSQIIVFDILSCRSSPNHSLSNISLFSTHIFRDSNFGWLGISKTVIIDNFRRSSLKVLIFENLSLEKNAQHFQKSKFIAFETIKNDSFWHSDKGWFHVKSESQKNSYIYSWLNWTRKL